MVMGGVLLTALIVVFVNTEWRLSTEAPIASTTAALGDLLFSNKLVLPLEIASVLLLAAMIGAVVLARGDDD